MKTLDKIRKGNTTIFAIRRFFLFISFHFLLLVDVRICNTLRRKQVCGTVLDITLPWVTWFVKQFQWILLTYGGQGIFCGVFSKKINSYSLSQWTAIWIEMTLAHSILSQIVGNLCINTISTNRSNIIKRSKNNPYLLFSLLISLSNYNNVRALHCC